MMFMAKTSQMGLVYLAHLNFVSGEKIFYLPAEGYVRAVGRAAFAHC